MIAYHPTDAGPCRWCGRPAFTTDEAGPVHPCCELEQRADCGACSTSASLATGAANRTRYRARHAAIGEDA